MINLQRNFQDSLDLGLQGSGQQILLNPQKFLLHEIINISLHVFHLFEDLDFLWKFILNLGWNALGIKILVHHCNRALVEETLVHLLFDEIFGAILKLFTCVCKLSGHVKEMPMLFAQPFHLDPLLAGLVVIKAAYALSS
jgi:hypothetical protein